MFSEEKKREVKDAIKKRFHRSYALYLSFLSRHEFKYGKWLKKHEKNLSAVEPLEINPSFSVVVPVYNTIDEQLNACIRSILKQTYRRFELILVDDCSDMESVRDTLRGYENNRHVKVIYRKENGNIAVATNDGIHAAKGDYLVFCDCDDTLSINALYELAKKINENPDYDFLYSDEDKLTEDGKCRLDPFFKPDWSPDTFFSMMYTSHVSAYRRTLALQTGGLRSDFNGAQDYDFTLRFMELSANDRVGHVPKILYHWRQRKESTASGMEAKPYAMKAQQLAKQEALARRGLSGEVLPSPDMNQYRVVYHCSQEPLVSIVIPSKDNYDILLRCLTSLWETTDYKHYEVILVDNGSGQETREKLISLSEEKGFTYLYEKADFNFSHMCNLGASAAKGEYILLLNDDMEIVQSDWLDILVGQAALPYVGAVGAKLLYPNTDLIQHVGVINLQVGPSHALLKEHDSVEHYFGRNYMNYNVLAVTGACLLVKREKYMELGGMDEKLAVAYNDVDFCFSLYEKGYYNVVRNDVKLYHHESLSRGDDRLTEEKFKRLVREREFMYDKHPTLRDKDPFYNPNLAGNRVDYKLQM